MDEKMMIIFIGEKVRKKTCLISSKPSFFDAVRLSNEVYSQTTRTTYQRIPLDSKNYSIQLSDSDIQLTFDRDSFMIKEGSSKLTEEEVIDIINNFAFKKGNKVTFLRMIPYRKNRKRKKNKRLVLAARKKLEDE